MTSTLACVPQTQLVREALQLMTTVQLVEPTTVAREGLTATGEQPACMPFWALTAFTMTRPLSLDQVRARLGNVLPEKALMQLLNDHQQGRDPVYPKLWPCSGCMW